MSRVYVVNKGAHDYSPAAQFGEVIFLSEGLMSRFAVGRMYRRFHEVLADSEPEDYLLLTSLPTAAVVAAAILAHKHGRLNLLLYRGDRYIERSIKLED